MAQCSRYIESAATRSGDGRGCGGIGDCGRWVDDFDEHSAADTQCGRAARTASHDSSGHDWPKAVMTLLVEWVDDIGG